MRSLRAHLVRALAFALAIAPGSAAATDWVNDPLTGSAGPYRGSQGGSFGPEGWTTAGATDAIWYEIPAALPSGRIEYSVKGISTTTSLTGADHDLLAMYQAPSGVGEPVAYSPYFRNNDMKVFTRIFGVVEGPPRTGAIKLELAFCPRGDPWYHDEQCAPECDGSGLAYAGGQPMDLGWDPAAWYRMALYWGNGKMAFSRDGVEQGAVTYPGEYSPDPVRVRLGSPRHGISPDAFMPAGLTFKDVLIQGDAGAQSAVCTSMPPPPDAGPLEDAGAPDAGACSSAAPIQFAGLTPASGSGVEQVFHAVYSHCSGADALRVVQFWVGDAVDPAKPNVSGGFENGILYVDGGNQSCAPGEAKVLTLPQGAVDCALSKVTASGNDLAVDWALRFDAATFAGTHLFFVDAKGGVGTPEPRLGWTDVGTYTVKQPDTPDAGSGAGGSGTGATGGAGSGAGGHGTGAGGGNPSVPGSASGCGCAVPAGSEAHATWLLALSALAASRRRRTRQGAMR